jgi:hypothetical protein
MININLTPQEIELVLRSLESNTVSLITKIKAQARASFEEQANTKPPEDPNATPESNPS